MAEDFSWLSVPAIAAGILALAAPIIRLAWNSRRQTGSSTGRGAVTRTWPFLLLLTAVFAAAGILLWKPLPFPFSICAARTASTAGAVLYFPGIGLYGWSLAAIGGQFGVSGIFGAGLYRNHRLVRHGPYGMIRHPMYLGVILAAAGALLIFRTWAMLLFAPLSLVVILRAEREERLLAEEFGREWKAYASAVPKWLPRIR
jgi:protein-S-isoprenylcysteine O-methyltransferase Ste14